MALSRTMSCPHINEEKGVNSAEEALQGAKDILAEMISDDADVRDAIRNSLLEHSTVQSTKTKEKRANKNKKDVYEIYHDFKIETTRVKPYQTLAINRGETEGFLKISFGFNKVDLLLKVSETYFNFDDSVFMDILNDVVDDSFTRLIFPSIEREVRNYLTEMADKHAIDIFAANLRQLLLQPPIMNKIIMGIDPGGE